uniref:(northern house mosquito) hypothetical protein n=1 Tax=Culex pipiens TaxID=7175 RepID=A0A8D8ACR4_CULPI
MESVTVVLVNVTTDGPERSAIARRIREPVRYPKKTSYVRVVESASVASVPAASLTLDRTVKQQPERSRSYARTMRTAPDVRFTKSWENSVTIWKLSAKRSLGCTVQSSSIR